MSDRYPQYPPGTMSVTEVIKAAGFMPEYQSQDAQWYMDRGSAIHSATELYDLGTLDESTVDTAIAGYLESYKKLSKQYPPDLVEIRLHDPVYRYAGTLDRIDCDIKSGAPAAWHKIQLSAYWSLKKLAGLGSGPMSAVYLQADGSLPKVVEYTIKDMQEGLKIFLAALVVARWKKENVK